jgi:ATP-binding protein involved in chromosome partitioning
MSSHNLSNVKQIVAIAAGKGGVGKSTLAVNLALYFQSQGYRVGLMDADLYGPSLKKMVPEEALPAQQLERISPAHGRGMKLISMAYFLSDKNPTSVRAPIANGIIKQFLHLVEWGELDFLFIDFPPGTGDIQLTLIQEGMLSGAVLVTTPQEVALLDVRKTAEMFVHMQVPIVGVVENMSYLMVENEVVSPFGQGGGEQFALEMGLLFLGKIPIEPKISYCGDRGKSLFEEGKETPAAAAIVSIGEKVKEQLDAFAKLNESIFIREIRQKDDRGFTIEWSDGKISDCHLGQVQSQCPCARCRGEKPQIDRDVKASRILSVGNYAVQVFFTTGCSKGIYPFWLLRQM